MGFGVIESLALTGIMSAASSLVGAKHAKDQAASQMEAAAVQQRQRQSEIENAARIEERRRQEQLRREQAQRMARFGARGVGHDGGSAEAVLAGLGAESARRGAEQADVNRLAVSGSLLDLQNRNRAALLSAAQGRDQAILGLGRAATSFLHERARESARATGRY